MRHLAATALLLVARPALAETVPEPPPSSPTVLVGGVSSGLIARDGGPDSPYATLSLTAYRDRHYVRGAVTWYRSTLRQVDAALPSTFVVGSLGAGGNWQGWVLDAYVSYGRQSYGQVVTALGARDSMAGRGAPFAAGGVRAGHSFALGARTWLTATGSISAVASRSLRHAVDQAGPADIQIADRAVTGSAALRIDRSVGRLWIGLSEEHFISTNGSTVLARTADAVPGAPVADRFAASATPDRWSELGASATARLGKGIWLDLEARRSFGAVAGNTSTATLGLRVVL